jgi:hypothetical protein
MVRPQADGPIGVVLVHGIGRQRPLDAVHKFVRALRRAYGDLELREAGQTVQIALPGATVRVYEAYWADLLAGDRVEGTFRLDYPHMVCWFPWLNQRGGMYGPGLLPNRMVRLRVAVWTCLFLPLALSMQLLLGLAYLLAAAFRRSEQFVRLMDEVPGDVFNYASSAACAAPPGSPLYAVADEIEGRLGDALVAARADGCSQLVVVAHSLGTLIAVRVLFGDRSSELPRVHCLHTIGSPLRRVRFIWPLLVPNPRAGSVPGVAWHNFWDPLDLISTRFSTTPGSPPVHNHCVLGRAGLGSAHVTYEDHPRFMAVFARSLGHEAPRARLDLVIRVRLAIRSVFESLGLIGGLTLALLTGVLCCVLVAAILGAVVALPSGNDGTAGARWVFDHFGILTLVVAAPLFVFTFIGLPLTRGRYEADLLHYAYRFHRPPRPPADVPKYEVDIPDRATRPLAVIAVLVLAGAIYLGFQIPVGRLKLFADSLFARFGNHVGRTLVTVAQPVIALLAAAGIFLGVLFLVACVVNLWQGAVNGVRRYRSYIERTREPPVD